MLLPEDYSDDAIADEKLKQIIKKIHIVHGGPDYDSLYPEGIPASVSINHDNFGELDGGRCLFPLGHARSDELATMLLVNEKFERLVAGAVSSPQAIRKHLRLRDAPTAHVANLYAFPIRLLPENT